MVKLYVIDHHRSDYIKNKPITIPKFKTEAECISAVSECINKKFDLILSDADPDGYLSALLYSLSQGIKQPQYKCYRVPLSLETLQIFENNGIQSIIAFDWFPLYGTDLSIFEEVVLINPTHSGLFERTSTSELVYRAIGNKSEFMRDINAIGVVCDYGVQSGQETIAQTVLAYPELFRTLVESAESRKLNRYNVYESPFSELTEMYWAPYIVKGERGAQELVELILQNSPFSYTDLFNYTHHPAVKYLRGMHNKLASMLKSEQLRYRRDRQIDGPVVVYEPSTSSPGFVQKFSSMLCQDEIGKVFLIKTRVNGSTKYSVRQRGLFLDLGRLLEDMRVGGGHPEAAGAMVADSKTFETAFIERVKNELAV